MTSAGVHRTKAGWLPLCVLFFLSGAVGLAYEVAWSRALLLLLGSTAGASALVLGVFVAGLGLGARWGGQRAETSERPLALYGVLEILAAAWAVLGVLLLGLLGGPYVAIASAVPEALRLVLRLLLAAFIVFPSAFLLGATLPAMVRHFVAGVSGTGRMAAWLYGLNTIGAVAGCLWTGFVGVELLGVRGVLFASAGLAVAIGIVSIALAKTAEARERQPEPPVGGSARSAMLVALVCGFIGLGVEVAGFRILVFFLEGFTVTFAAMLGVFIAGLGAGSLVLGPRLAQTDRPARILGVLLVLQAALVVVALYVVVPNLEGWMKGIKSDAYRTASTEAEITGALRWASVMGAGILLFLPAFLMGPTFPLCVRWAERAGLLPGHAVGRVYVGNSIGSVIAPFLLTFAIIPGAGVLGAWLMVGVVALVFGLALIVMPRGRLKRPPVISALALGALLVALLAPLIQLKGARTQDLVEASVVLSGRSDRALVDHATDAVTTASVVETKDGERILYTDDFAAAATGRYYRYMRMLGHLPAILAKDPQNAMVIAFGTGTTAGAVAAHETVKRLEVVEVSSAVLELADHFEEANRRVLDDERVRVVRDDGRNALLLHEPDLDLITLEPLMPYSPQGLPFYTREFYELARDRLRDGGVVCQWVPVHAMRADMYAAFVRTFFEVFPQGTLWFFEQSTALIGWKGDGRPTREAIEARAKAVAGDLAEAGFDEPMAFTSGYVATGKQLLKGPHPTSPQPSYFKRTVSDSDPFPEFHPTPRASLNTRYLEHTLSWLADLVDPGYEPTKQPWWPALMQGRRGATKQSLRGRQYGARAQYLGVFAASPSLPTQDRAAVIPEMLEHHDLAALELGGALRTMPYERVWRRRRLQNLRSSVMVRAISFMRRGDQSAEPERTEMWTQAAMLMRSVMPPAEPDPEPVATDRIQAARTLAMIQLRLGRCANAAAVLESAVEETGMVQAGRELIPAAQAARALADGKTVTEPAWLLFADREPCREGGLAPVASEWSAFLAAVHAKSDARAAAAALRLEQAARQEGLEAAVADALPGFDVRGATPAAQALAAGLSVGLAPPSGMDRDPLSEMCADRSPALRRAALAEIGRRQAADRYRDEIARGLSDEEPRVRSAAVILAPRTEDRTLLCRAVEALMDPVAEVRKDAVGALFHLASEELERYDALGTDAERRPIVEALKTRLGCGRGG